MSKKGGTVCAIRGCANITTQKGLAFFRFPREPERIKQWLKKCLREDLNRKSPLALYNNYRICASHFENRMYANDLKNRLLPTAIPTIFPYPNGQDAILDQPVENIFIVLDNTYASGIKSKKVEEFADGPPNLQGPSNSSPSSTIPTQTPRPLKKLRTHRKIALSRSKKIKVGNCLTLEEKKKALKMFDKYCDEFLPKKLSNFVKLQARLHAKRHEAL